MATGVVVCVFACYSRQFLMLEEKQIEMHIVGFFFSCCIGRFGMFHWDFLHVVADGVQMLLGQLQYMFWIVEISDFRCCNMRGVDACSFVGLVFLNAATCVLRCCNINILMLQHM